MLNFWKLLFFLSATCRQTYGSSICLTGFHELIAGVIACAKQETNSNEKGDRWVGLGMRLGWRRCAPAERLLQMPVRTRDEQWAAYHMVASA